MVEKNVCQNPTCYAKRNKDQWNKNANAFQSRKAYFKKGHNSYKTFEYFCTTSCANTWLEDNIENIIERNHIPRKIIEKIIGS